MGIEATAQVVLVLSGKGGVGKSTVAASVALALVSAGHRVGILDVDLTGPSLPYLLGLADTRVMHTDAGWVPARNTPDSLLKVMSLGFLLPSRDDPVIWRGPKKTAMVANLISNVDWGQLDYLIVDTPPGTSDEHLAVLENVRKAGAPTSAIVVTTPQGVSVADVRKELSFCSKLDIPVLGIVENMSGYVCPHCSECSNVFSKGGGEALAIETKHPFLGAIPIDPTTTLMLERDGWIKSFAQSNLAPLFNTILQKATLLPTNDNEHAQTTEIAEQPE